MTETFRALMLTKDDAGVHAAIRDVPTADLPDGDVTVRISHSTLNYKDGMVLNGLGRLVRDYPHIPGIDFAGVVEASDNPAYKPGDPVVLTGWRVGEIHWGGYAELARVKGDWLVPLPKGLDARHAMAVGTAGLTAMLAIMTLEENGASAASDREVLVTGASGGVGSIATALLSRAGFRVAAVTGSAEAHDYLRGLGAGTIVPRAEIAEPPAKPLLSERWAGVIDTVCGPTLAHAMAETAHGGAIAAVGNAGGIELSGTILPFLLRGIRLIGIDSVTCPTERRVEAWRRIAETLPASLLDDMATDAGLSDLPALGRDILKGKIRGRLVIDVTK